ncbi:MAG: hypothetical protein A3F84_08590 [Candidatus Handelsmanbacteria bacterium RIFCSPLOWO2_12_FULL_64_10]|uniref:Uncharacterized protein n=1 Tax=Handelsmanbacteria sp. (strain RIFCSPLOWO2_12_FULL_64_10) TaxID=1817868 RepID=A0A1F6CKJ0_HANXR|nr:MAG: hypothetical protein A3F84_08590 [Candidatus Handelsmanbacteria bacterium RIFCSPLOWO2_12_FULL_64_10]
MDSLILIISFCWDFYGKEYQKNIPNMRLFQPQQYLMRWPDIWSSTGFELLLEDGRLFKLGLAFSLLTRQPSTFGQSLESRLWRPLTNCLRLILKKKT